MRVWLDGQCLQSVSRLRGIGRYVRDWIRALSETAPDLDLLISFNAALRDEAIEARQWAERYVPRKNVHIWHGAVEAGEDADGYVAARHLSEIALAHHVALLAPDIAVSTSPFEGRADLTVPLLATHGHGCALAALCYDFIPYRYKEQYLPHALWVSNYERRLDCLRAADRLLAISDFSAREAGALCPSTPVSTIYAGLSQDFLALVDEAAEPEPAAPGERRFLLYVGAIDWRKNVDIVPRALRLLPAKLAASLDFVVAGDVDPGQAAQLRAAWRRAELDPHALKMLGHVPDRDLVSLYRRAAVVIQPSFMEGFGLTLLEALAAGAPVLAADAGAMPEIAASRDALFDPHSPEDLAARLGRMLSGESLERLRDAGRQSVARFTWAASARATHEAFARILADRGPCRGDETEQIRARTARAVRAVLDQSTANEAGATAADGRAFAPEHVSTLIALAEHDAPARPPRLLVEVTSTAHEDHGTGIQRVVKKISQELLRSWPKDLEFRYCDGPAGFLEPVVGPEVGLRPPPLGELHRATFRNGDKLLLLDSSWSHHTFFEAFLPEARLCGVEVISTLYDLVPLKTPAFCAPGMSTVFADWFDAALRYSTGFVCISKTVADELVELLRAIDFRRRMRIGWWPLGADFHAERKISHAARAPRPVFLMVGTIEPRKGHRVALAAFDALWAAGVDVDLVVAGKEGWGVEALAETLAGHPEAGRRLRHLSKVDDGELAALYASCDALVSASFAEGYGLPIAEAARFGKPVIASDLPVFREVAAGANAVWFEAGSPKSLEAAVLRFLAERPPQQSVAVAGTSWAESAAALRNLVMEDAWPFVYEPVGGPEPYRPGVAAATIDIPPSLPADGRRHRLELVYGPVETSKGAELEFVFRLTNTSTRLWSSRGKNGVFLGYNVRDRHGKVALVNTMRAPIPYVLPPGDSIYLSIRAPKVLRARGGVALAFEMLQEGVGWWGEPVVTPFD